MAVTVRVVSGGQTGVDRAALDAARACGLPHHGWCPCGRLAEDGTIPEQYGLTETPMADYDQRTEWNVRDSDATLILHTGHLSGGTAFTAEIAQRYGRPLMIVELGSSPSPAPLVAWIHRQQIACLNIAGPRESGSPGIYRQAYAFLVKLFGEVLKF